MRLVDFDYLLPTHLVAQYPTNERRDARLLVLNENSKVPSHLSVADVFSFFKPGDLLVLNDTRVIKARFEGRKSTGGLVELLVERVLSDKTALVHIRSNRTPKIGSSILLFEKIHLIVTSRLDQLFEVEIATANTFEELLMCYGKLPLPPYIERNPTDDDDSRYQTVYARVPGAIAAPTAGLHIDEQLIRQLLTFGVDISYLTLHVGAGTFRPVKEQDISKHKIHSERVLVPATTMEAVRKTKERGGRIVAVGTTVMRALETIATIDDRIGSFEGETDLFITPGFKFRVVDVLMTNFHLPRSTLLMLVCAFAGFERTMEAYRIAVQKNYRFFSYGDAMWVDRSVFTGLRTL